MLDGLTGRDNAGIKNRLVIDLAHHFFGFLEKAIDSLALFGRGRFIDEFENLVEALDLLFSLGKVRVKHVAQLVRLLPFSIIIGRDSMIRCSA